MEQNITWGAIIPLIGGFPIGSYLATQSKPKFIISYPAFMDNDQHIRNYWPDVPYILINPETNQFYSNEEIDDIMKKYKFKRPDNNRIKEIDFSGVDFVNSTCPCAGLSMMNSSNKKDSAAARGSNAAQNEWLYKSSEFILETIKPRVLFGENAPGLYTNTGVGVVDKLYAIAKKYNYSISLYKTNTVYHGIPQKRERTFFFFWDSNQVPILDNYRREHKHLKDYLVEIPEKASLQDKYAGLGSAETNPFVLFMKKKVGDNWRIDGAKAKTATSWLVKNGYIDEMISWMETDYHYELDGIKDYKGKILKYLNHVKEKVAKSMGWWDSTPHFFDDTTNAIIGRTIQTALHPVEDRGLNLRECMHLMGLPHDFEIKGLEHYNHIAQNVPTCTARDMTYEVIKYLKGETKMSGVDFMKQSNSTSKIETPLNNKQLF